MQKQDRDDILLAASLPQPSLVREVSRFLMTTKKWWLTPILMAVLVFAVLIFLGGTAAAPFIYTLF